MALVRNLTLASFALAAVAASGCVGPMACGPTGCDVAGPIARNSCGGCDGCGELYVDPWINEPADACDPCDQCGNYNGQSCGKCRSVFSGFASLWGYRCDAPPVGCGVDACDGGAGGCDSCAGQVRGPSEVRGPVEIYESGTTYGPGEVIPPGEPTPADEGDLEDTPGDEDYQPRRTRRIFRNRGGRSTEMPHPSDY